VIEKSKKTEMPEMKRMIPSGSENGTPICADDTEHDYRQLIREGLAAREELSPTRSIRTSPDSQADCSHFSGDLDVDMIMHDSSLINRSKSDVENRALLWERKGFAHK
jgi:hypothetical protein